MLSHLPAPDMLTETFASRFTPDVRKGGKRQHREGRVRILRGTASRVAARVDDGRWHDVLLFVATEQLGIQCQCTEFAGGQPCTHAWAALLAAEGKGYLARASSLRDIWLSGVRAGAGLVTDQAHAPGAIHQVAPSLAKAEPAPSWRRRLTELMAVPATSSRIVLPAALASREVCYVIDAPMSASRGRLVVNLMTRRRGDQGTQDLELVRVARPSIPAIPDPEDRSILGTLDGAAVTLDPGASEDWAGVGPRLRVVDALVVEVVRRMARTGRCFLRPRDESSPLLALAWDEDPAWSARLALERGDAGSWDVVARLHRGADRVDLSVPDLVVAGGLVFHGGRVAPLDDNGAVAWAARARRVGPCDIPDGEVAEATAELLTQPGVPPLDVPEELRFEEVRQAPRPRLRVRAGGADARTQLVADLAFEYDGHVVAESATTRGAADAARRRIVLRDPAAEQAARALLAGVGLTPPQAAWLNRWAVPAHRLSTVTRRLVGEGWIVEAEGKLYRSPSAWRSRVSSGTDWFDLEGDVTFDEQRVPLAEILRVLRRGETMIQLGDGTVGMLPEEWLRRHAPLAELAALDHGRLRFARSQAALLDALLAAQPDVTCDEPFERLRGALATFSGLQPARQPRGFKGALRAYQREGLGWMLFLRELGFGGCLADDMGVGKTAQVLALLQWLRSSRAPRAGTARRLPSLVVVPRSLVFNWKEEAARFTPALRVLDHTGAGRSTARFTGQDVVLTTYGTLRRDAATLRDALFDTIVLDEAQVVKNADTDVAKAVRLLRGRHRLALSGTPIENHLGELWSLFEFLNPGMLGTSGRLAKVLAAAGSGSGGGEVTGALARALGPFILRRTKAQVAPELPARTEQTLWCELEGPERDLYDGLRAHFRTSIKERIQTEGFASARMHVLEGLLRLRQAACHPGLIDPSRAGRGSAKTDALLAQLEEVVGEGHAALVFSQFTSLLAIVRRQLEERGVAHEYLDGATRDRQAPVERFQRGECPVFLVSLRAGGQGLNLTAADYVFLLDPWWNPAVEAQAIDRAHRIGQAKPVFAYRLVARDTVEERVLDLQRTKRALAEAILGADGAALRGLRREDLELLLA
jgi:superfamily II DNA or RNA helicase